MLLRLVIRLVICGIVGMLECSECVTVGHGCPGRCGLSMCCNPFPQGEVIAASVPALTDEMHGMFL